MNKWSKKAKEITDNIYTKLELEYTKIYPNISKYIKKYQEKELKSIGKWLIIPSLPQSEPKLSILKWQHNYMKNTTIAY